MNKNTLIVILENFAIFFTLGILQFLIFGVIAPLVMIMLIIISWLPYLGTKAYFEAKKEIK